MADVPAVRPEVDPRRTCRSVPVTFALTEGLFQDYAPPGSFEMREGYMLLACPGCGRVSGMTVGDPKPDNGNGATWRLTGPPESPTLSPSVNCTGCCGWHGWLKSGVFAV